MLLARVQLKIAHAIAREWPSIQVQFVSPNVRAGAGPAGAHPQTSGDQAHEDPHLQFLRQKLQRRAVPDQARAGEARRTHSEPAGVGRYGAADRADKSGAIGPIAQAVAQQTERVQPGAADLSIQLAFVQLIVIQIKFSLLKIEENL